MRHSSRISLLLSAAVLAFGFSFAQAQAVQGPMAPDAPPSFEMDKKGKRDKIDFMLKPQPVSDPNLKFSQFGGKKMLLFYFSAKCPHCQQAFPHIQKLADELSSKGYGALALAIKYNTEEDIRGFIRDYGVRMPVMQDEDRNFGDRYGVGTIPTIYLINEKGEYVRYKTFDAVATPSQIRTVAASWAPKKK
jgi:peroxiredoxin